MFTLSEYDMAPLKFTKLVGFSSEDPQFPASNLLAKGKWKCKEEGEKQAWVCLQLEELSTITNIDIGNNGAAFVEVQVGRQGCDMDQMKVLLVASSFMSVNEARVGDNAARVRMFTQDKLAAEVAREKWDIVKMIATQPFNKHSKYGLSFISLTGPPKTQPKPTTPISKLGAFKLMDDNVESIAVGSYFAKKKEIKQNDSNDKSLISAPKPSVAATMRQPDTNLAEVTLKTAKKLDKKRKLEITPAAKEEIKKRRVERDFPSRTSLPGETQESPELKKINKPSTSKENKAGSKEIISMKDKEASRDNLSLSQQTKTDKTSLKKKTYLKFNEFFKGVNFAISGFQNPLRGEIRQKALDMGARYHGDWNSTCTHLVCAFTNTPKFNQVKGKGKIVKKEWIELCHSHRKRFPWRRFCLDKDDKNKDESEDEIFEEGANHNVGNTDEKDKQIKADENKKEKLKEARKLDYDCDTDEEIEKMQVDENEKKKHEKVNKTDYDCDTDEEIERIQADEKLNHKAEFQCNNNEEEGQTLGTDKYDCDTDDEQSNNDDPYDAETDIDEEEIERLLPNVSNLTYNELPSFFRGKNFHVDSLFPASERKLFVRYITACGGFVSSTSPAKNLQIVISKSKKRLEVLGDEDTLFVQPAWLFACKDADSFLDPSKYLVM